MRKNFIKIFLFSALLLGSTSCEDFLDISPESGVTKEEVFARLDNVKAYLKPVYTTHLKYAYPFYFGAWDQKWTLEELTDAADSGNQRPSRTIRLGSFLDANAKKVISDTRNRPVLQAAFTAIRICNDIIANVDKVQDAANQSEIDDVKAQAYFFRGFAYFQVTRLWGGMPYITHVMTSDEDWDLPRLTACETYIEIAKDMDTAFQYFEAAGKVRRDPKPGESGHNNYSAYELVLPNGCAAKALKSRALLYAASPLNNKENDNSLWEQAALAASDAINTAEDNGFELLDIDHWLDNTFNKQSTNEQLWADTQRWALSTGNRLKTYLTGPMHNNPNLACGVNPTQNFVDRYETAGLDGTVEAYALNTEEDRELAIRNGKFNEQNPYAYRDKRLALTVWYNGATLPYAKTHVSYSIPDQINMWYEVQSDGTRKLSDHIILDGFIGTCTTGYMQRRITNDMNWNNATSKHLTDPLFLLSELYLNYAEAAAHLDGGKDAKVEGARYSSYEALMKIRNRAEQGDVPSRFLESNDLYIERIKNERAVELAFIGHYYFDMLRWKDAEKYMTKSNVLYGIDVEKVPVSGDYPTGYKYTRVPLGPTQQFGNWNDQRYYWPFTLTMYYQFKNFQTSWNPYW